MKNKKDNNQHKKLPLWLKILCGFIVIILLLIGVFLSYFAIWNYKNNQAEKLIDKKFHQEVAQVPLLKVKNFMLWEGDSMVTVDIENKGEVRFWYGKDGVPRIDSIAQYSTSYTCFYVDKSGKKANYAYDTSLVLDKESNFTKWFPFQVNNLKDLVEKYDLITSVLKTFPKNPQTISFEDRWGKRDVIAQPNPEFIVKTHFSGKEAFCDLHQ